MKHALLLIACLFQLHGCASNSIPGIDCRALEAPVVAGNVEPGRVFTIRIVSDNRPLRPEGARLRQYFNLGFSGAQERLSHAITSLLIDLKAEEIEFGVIESDRTYRDAASIWWLQAFDQGSGRYAIRLSSKADGICFEPSRRFMRHLIDTLDEVCIKTEYVGPLPNDETYLDSKAYIAMTYPEVLTAPGELAQILQTEADYVFWHGISTSEERAARIRRGQLRPSSQFEPTKRYFQRLIDTQTGEIVFQVEYVKHFTGTRRAFTGNRVPTYKHCGIHWNELYKVEAPWRSASQPE